MSQMTEPKKVTAAKPPLLGKTSRVVLIVVILLVVLGGLYYLYQQQSTQQANLSQELSSLQKLVSAQSNPGAVLEAEIKQAEADLADIKDSFYRLDSAPEILDKLISMAKTNDIDITSTSITETRGIFTAEKQKLELPILRLQLGVRGQISKFQNFLLSIESMFPLSQVKNVNMEVIQEENEQDTGSITIEFYCLNEVK